ncbi:MAG: hypothetical protein D6814_14415, partial [Calditrichaeota bacterium]
MAYLQILQHIRQLSGELEHRGSGTRQEYAAHEYCRKTLASLGLSAHWETFYSPASAYRPFILASAFMIIAYAVFYFVNFMAGLLFGLVTLYSAFSELLFKPGPLTWILPRKKSQNVWGVVRAKIK